MLKAGFVSSSPEWRWQRQFPSEQTVWGDVEFVFEGDLTACDVVFVYDGLFEQQAKQFRAKRAVFVAGEPQSVKSYDTGFLRQFDCVLTTDLTCQHPNRRLGQLGLPWHLGVWDDAHTLLRNPLTYSDFMELNPKKTKTISVVSSNKAFTEGHRARLAFVEKLKQHFGDEIDVFGRNIKSFGDKVQVLNSYRYHIAIENSVHRDYWTEKLADPFLANCYPIYHGCPNIADYFPERSLTCIDINEPETAIQTIQAVLDADLAATATQSLLQAKMKVLTEYNVFSVLAGLAAEVCRQSPRVRALESEKFYVKYPRPLQRQAQRGKRLVRDFLRLR